MLKNAKYRNGEESWRVIDYPVIVEETGELGVIEYGKEMGFVVKRIFYLRNIKENATRGLHSHKELKQIIVCLNGAFTLELNNGLEKYSERMLPENHGIYVDGKVWREMKNFTEDAVVMVLCDREYRFDEVIRDHAVFLKNLEDVNNDL